MADFVNGGFETGNLTGWTLTPGGTAANAVQTFVRSAPSVPYTYVPQAGSWFLKINSGSASSGTWQTVHQTIALTAGQVVSGKAAFAWGDNAPFFDGARVRILNGTTVIATPWTHTGQDYPDPAWPSSPSPYLDYYNGPWETWSWTVPSDGSYKIELGALNSSDGSLSSFGLFDAMSVTTPYTPTQKALITEEIPLVIQPDFNPEGKVMIRQSDPIPTTIVCITYEVVIGG